MHMHVSPIRRSLRIQFLITVVGHLLKPKTTLVGRNGRKEGRKWRREDVREGAGSFFLIESSWPPFRKNFSFCDSELVWLFFISRSRTLSGFHPFRDWLVMSWTNVNCFHRYFLIMQWSSHLLPRAYCLFLKFI